MIRKIYFPLNLFFVLLIILSVNFTISAEKDRWLIFEGEVEMIGESPKVLCGIFAPYRLAKYKVSRVYEGDYAREAIVVDHLFVEPMCLKISEQVKKSLW